MDREEYQHCELNKKTNKRREETQMLQDIRIEILEESMKDKFLWPNITFHIRMDQRTIMQKKFHKINQEVNSIKNYFNFHMNLEV